jgi:predicted MPP superfamily phosphohydrolase
VGVRWPVTYWRTLLGVVLGGALLGGAVYARKVEPENVEVVSVPLVLPRLDGRFDGYRIAQISDLHADDWMTPGRASHLVDLVNAEEPDLVLITGDRPDASICSSPATPTAGRWVCPFSGSRCCPSSPANTRSGSTA